MHNGKVRGPVLSLDTIRQHTSSVATVGIEDILVVRNQASNFSVRRRTELATAKQFTPEPAVSRRISYFVHMYHRRSACVLGTYLL